MSAPSLHSDQEKGYEVQHDFASKSTPLSDELLPLSAAEEKKLIRRIDFKLVPFLSLLYLLSFLDRVNIGQARLDGLEADLGLTGSHYQIALLMFFVGYVITEVPSNMLLKKIRPSRLIPGIMLVWGIIMTCMGFVKNYEQLVALRFLLGLSESALFPGCCFYLVSWYKRDESQLRIAIFFSSATLSGAFGGLLAFGIGKMRGIGGLPGWAWIFILEGLLTVVVGVAAFWLIEDFPEDAKFLTERERAHIVRRLSNDVGAAGASVDWKQVKKAFTSWQTYVYCLIYIGVAEPLYSLSLFVPTIIASLGTWTRPQAQLLSVPPYALAFIVTLVTALISDRLKTRGLANVFWMTIVVIGFAIQIGIDPIAQPGVAYFAIFLCVVGVAPCIANSITWVGNNNAPLIKRGTVMGAFFTTGNSGGIVSSVVYRTQDKPRYFIGHGVGLGFASMALILSAFMYFYYKAENARRDRKYGPPVDPSLVDTPEERSRLGLDGMSDEEIRRLGDKHPNFRYFP
ncbi:hypothetical protein JCM8547_000559 [Rhodosporidiobolus lusitaniae]